MGTKTTGVGHDRVMAWAERRVKMNISDFEKIIKIGRLLEGDGLESNEVNFKVDADPGRGPKPIDMHHTNKHLGVLANRIVSIEIHLF